MQQSGASRMNNAKRAAKISGFDLNKPGASKAKKPRKK